MQDIEIEVKAIADRVSKLSFERSRDRLRELCGLLAIHFEHEHSATEGIAAKIIESAWLAARLGYARPPISIDHCRSKATGITTVTLIAHPFERGNTVKIACAAYGGGTKAIAPLEPAQRGQALARMLAWERGIQSADRKRFKAKLTPADGDIADATLAVLHDLERSFSKLAMQSNDDDLTDTLDAKQAALQYDRSESFWRSRIGSDIGVVRTQGKAKLAKRADVERYASEHRIGRRVR